MRREKIGLLPAIWESTFKENRPLKRKPNLTNMRFWVSVTCLTQFGCPFCLVQSPVLWPMCKFTDVFPCSGAFCGCLSFSALVICSRGEGEIGQVKYPLHTKISLLGGQIGEFEFQRELGVCAQDTGRGSLNNLDARLCPGCGFGSVRSGLWGLVKIPQG